ncbi:hypothetical protein SAMN04490239_0861 [Rhodococcus koreensis]|uniref:Uncharacterized protein n=1 Tax=Rhodococcus koreensis TaxID=99653 RepID=A0A1H4KRN1_9NOCA|nr:hypothetical protein SAMN04490239_0861 [Rhodococcus koreensis]
MSIDELALSVRGWEVQDVRARVSTEDYGKGNHFHKLAVSGVLRFNSDDWTDCFGHSRDYPPPVVIAIRSPKLSEHEATFRPVFVSTKEATRPVRFSENDWFVHTYEAIDHDDLTLTVTAYDGYEGNGHMPYIPVGIEPIPLEVVDDTTRPGTQLAVNQIHVFTHADDNATYGGIQASGRVTVGTIDELATQHREGKSWITAETPLAELTPFECPVPQLSFDFLDETGFLLEQVRVRLGIEVPVSEDGRTPGRVASWRIDEDFNPDDFSEPAAKVIMRIEDNAWS